MISKFNHVKFSRFVWVAVGEEAKQRLDGNLETFVFTICLGKVENHFKNVLEKYLWKFVPHGRRITRFETILGWRALKKNLSNGVIV